MGIMTRKRGEKYLITSDRILNDAPSQRAPKRLLDECLFWTGDTWSMALSEGKAFDTLDEADEYTRANYARISSAS